MTADLVGLIYNTTSKVVRAIIIPELGDGLEDANLLNQQKNPPAEFCDSNHLSLWLKRYAAGHDPSCYQCETSLGLLPPVSCALVDKSGTVQDIVLADPVHTPTFNGFTVVPNSVGAGQGDAYDGANFKRKYAIYNKATGVVTSIQTVTLPGAPVTTATQQLAINNDNSLSLNSVVGVVAL